MADLTHTDWLLFSQQALIQQLDPTITTNIINSDIKNYLVVSNLNKTNIAQIRLITNTDRNNNYLYLDGFNVYVGDSPTPIKIPGVEEMMKNLVRFSDSNAFILGGKTHLPFAASNLAPANPPAGGAYADMDAFLTVFSTTVPKSVCANLGGKQLRYELILNPDAVLKSDGKYYTDKTYKTIANGYDNKDKRHYTNGYISNGDCSINFFGKNIIYKFSNGQPVLKQVDGVYYNNNYRYYGFYNGICYINGVVDPLTY